MQRSDVLNNILSLYDKPHYLEIGVDAGETFRAVKAYRKHGVDPDFKFDIEDPEFKTNGVEFFSLQSDDFFRREDRLKYHVAFIDGLHEFGQVLRDLLNVLPRMKKNGVIVIDDVIPCHYQASLPTLEKMLIYRSATGSSDMSWMGDVYKLLFFIRDYLPSYAYSTALEGHGQTMMWVGERLPEDAAPQNLRLDDIESVDYFTTVTNREVYNIRPFDSTFNHLKQIFTLNSKSP